METQFKKDLNTITIINGAESSVGVFNLLVSIRDVTLYSAGLIPHRGFSINAVKNYFGVKGNPQKVLEQLQQLKAGI